MMNLCIILYTFWTPLYIKLIIAIYWLALSGEWGDRDRDRDREKGERDAGRES